MDLVTAWANSSPHLWQKYPPWLCIGPPIAVSWCKAASLHHSQRRPSGTLSTAMGWQNVLFNVCFLLLVPTLLVQFPLNITLRSGICEEPFLNGELNEDEHWHQPKDEDQGQHTFKPFFRNSKSHFAYSFNYL
jgi:hypothetical protein